MLLVHKNIKPIHIVELDNNSESVWAKVFANEISHHITSWFQQPSGTSEDFQLFRNQLEQIRPRGYKT